jgi:hypothetical protein
MLKMNLITQEELHFELRRELCREVYEKTLRGLYWELNRELWMELNGELRRELYWEVYQPLGPQIRTDFQGYNTVC